MKTTKDFERLRWPQKKSKPAPIMELMVCPVSGRAVMTQWSPFNNQRLAATCVDAKCKTIGDSSVLVGSSPTSKRQWMIASPMPETVMAHRMTFQEKAGNGSWPTMAINRKQRSFSDLNKAGECCAIPLLTKREANSLTD